ncbi:MCE family protein [Mycobacterium deserti]|uniref:MCE family protein n=1 Tax=Mycobacterium deserti TaxID=2978347 RepID=A0ABT2M9L2_9MYCO|nr:MCE family protein [Mycobacterium deserti]MCT7657855.1 MCE family protein [Mycobacterium deserti]
MDTRRGRRLRPAWWTVILLVVVGGVFAFTTASFTGVFRSFVPVTLTSDRAGLVMESGAKVKLRGVQVGRVGGIDSTGTHVALSLQIDPDEVQFIPANVGAEIKATTVFGAKFVDLVYPEEPSRDTLAPGAVLRSRNVSTEVNTVFENLVGVLDQIDPPKLNAILSSVAEAVRGRGAEIGEAATEANEVLTALNARSPALAQNWLSLRGFSDAYGAAAQDLVTILETASATATTIADRAAQLDALLLNMIGFTGSGIELLATNQENLVRAVDVLKPTTGLVYKYNPTYTCLLLGAQWYLDNGGNRIGADGRTGVIDAGLGLGDDPYRYPDNLPIIGATGGPGGKPGCGSLPDASKNYPVRYLVTDTGFGTGVDVRTNHGIGHPWWVNYLPVTRAVPEPPSVRGEGPPAPGPVLPPGVP